MSCVIRKVKPAHLSFGAEKNKKIEEEEQT